MTSQKNRYTMYQSLALLLAVSVLLSVFVGFPVSVSAADPDYTFSSGAVLLDNSYTGKNVLIQNGVFSVTVSGATDVNIIFDSVTMDRRYNSDSNRTVSGLYNVAQSLGWVKNGTYTAQTCPLLLTNGASASVAFRGENNFYAGTNKCTVNSSDWYTQNQSGGGFAGIQVDSGSTLTIEPSGGTINAYGAFYVEGDNSENSSYGYGAPAGTTQNSLSGGAGIGGGAAWNTTTSASSSYTAGTPGTIIINGGNINAHGGHEGAGIGGGFNGAATSNSIAINAGNVNAYGGRWAAGIGDGDSAPSDGGGFYASTYGNNYSIVINGGAVNVVGGVNCPGIGSTDDITAGNYSTKIKSGMEIHLNGGTITARSGYPDGFNPNGTSGSTVDDAAAAIGAGNKTNMESNSIHVSSKAKIFASGFGHYSVTENGVKHDTRPSVNIDSDGYVFLGRFPKLTSYRDRDFKLFEAQRFDYPINGEIYQYVKYVTQPEDGSTAEIYYYCAEAPDRKWLKKAGADGSIATATDITLESLEVLKAKLEALKLTLYVDENSVKIDEIAAPKHFRSIALSLPNPQEHGGIYALEIPTAVLTNQDLPVDSVIITIGAQKQGTISGEMSYPSHMNIDIDSVSETLTDLDIYRDEQHMDGSDGLIGGRFMENVFAYQVYIEHNDTKAYLYAKYPIDDNVKVNIEPFDMDVSEQTIGTDRIITATLDMTGVTEKVVRLKKTDTVTVDGKTVTLNSVVYKITVKKKALYKIELNSLNKIYDGTAVKPSILRLYSEETGVDYTPTDDELRSVSYNYFTPEGTLWNPLADAPKNAGQYKVSAEIRAESFTAQSDTVFTISKRTLTVNRIQNPLTYVSAAEHEGWKVPRDVADPGTIYLSGVVGTDDVEASAASVFYNDISIGYRVDKITLTGITLSGLDVDNYKTDGTQYVFGQISYSLDGAIFKKKPGMTWDKFYPVDSLVPVAPGTADWHSPATNGVYDAHCDYVYARTENMGDSQSVYAVDIEFGAMYFTYSMSRWNVNSMVYEELSGESRWTGFEGGNNEIKVTNRSNTPIWYAPNVKVDFLHSAIGDSTAGIKANFYEENSASGTPITGVKQEVPAAIAGNHTAHGTAKTKTCYIRLSGVPQLGDSDHFTVVGNVWVTISRTDE